MADSDQPSAASAAAPVTMNLGELLRSARLAQGLTVEQIATELRIEAPHLIALEENNLERIGIPVFVKGYLRQYGQRLGVDVAKLHALYSKQAKLEDVHIQPSPTIHLRDERQITAWIIVAIVIAVLVGALAMWWTSGGSLSLISTAVAPSPVVPVVTAPAPVSAPAVALPAPTPIPAAPPADVVAPPVNETIAPAEGAGDEASTLAGSTPPAPQVDGQPDVAPPQAVEGNVARPTIGAQE
jgi:cytoskeleton protein RodZ